MNNLATLLAHYRQIEKLHAKHLAAQIGVSPSTIASVEAGRMMDGATLALILAWIMRAEKGMGATEESLG
jgi:DNA-binding XRE family transcriptional regulator